MILERPKLKDYREAIRESLARTLALPLDRVSVKFKTAEGVGPVGEGRSAEAQAIVTIALTRQIVSTSLPVVLRLSRSRMRLRGIGQRVDVLDQQVQFLVRESSPTHRRSAT